MTNMHRRRRAVTWSMFTEVNMDDPHTCIDSESELTKFSSHLLIYPLFRSDLATSCLLWRRNVLLEQERCTESGNKLKYQINCSSINIVQHIGVSIMCWSKSSVIQEMTNLKGFQNFEAAGRLLCSWCVVPSFKVHDIGIDIINTRDMYLIWCHIWNWVRFENGFIVLVSSWLVLYMVHSRVKLTFLALS